MIYSLHSLTVCCWIYCIKYFRPMHLLINGIIPPVRYDTVRSELQMNSANTGRRKRKKDI